MREKYCSGYKFTIVYDKPQPNEQAAKTDKVLEAGNPTGDLTNKVGLGEVQG